MTVFNTRREIAAAILFGEGLFSVLAKLHRPIVGVLYRLS